MFTDIVGYTALTQSNEAQALEVLRKHTRLLKPFFPRFRGREVKTIGDSFLLEFDSALYAVNCAIEIQKFLHDYNISSKNGWKIKLRIGIHLGDVERKRGDIFGDAVNIASRIEPLADSEGICISEQVYDQVRNKVANPMVEVSHGGLKNVATPICVYKVVMPWETAPREENDEKAKPSKFDPKRIAVLPFSNYSPDPNDNYLADGLTEELISTMSKISKLSVIARTSVMRYKDGEKGIDDIARDLKVGTILEGSVRKSGNKLRITVQLIDPENSDHLWAESYDRDLSDVFEIQREISETVAGALRIRLMPEEKEKIELESMDPLKLRYFWQQPTTFS
jgi:adenylate cyclase